MSNTLTISDLLPVRVRDRSTDKARHKSTERTIIAIDGEGITVKREHLYTLLAASSGDSIADNTGLSTRQCFDFLLGLKRDGLTSRYLFVGFSINYDVNMWLRDLSRKQLTKLLEDGRLYWHEYRLRWKPNRTFAIYNRHTRQGILIYDVFGFFQTSFVKSLRDWKVGDQSTVDAITAMKEKRGTFSSKDERDVTAYCFKECELLVQLMQRLISAVVHAEIPCSQWYGVGALASGLLKKHGVKKYMSQPPESMRDAILCSYFGGRFEIAGSGHFGRVIGYDIKSAYPSVARTLPCLAHTKYIHAKRYSGEANALVHVQWSVPNGSRFGPFPWRSEHRRILYPLNGRGWYWSVEVDAALRLYPHGHIKTLDAYVPTTTCDDRPFLFINTVYAERQRLEAAGDFAHKALKLSMNAIYGKTAQSLGNKEKMPPYQSYIWAGMITAGTRAMILDAIRESNDSVVSIATDGILSTKEIRSLHIGKGLGDWDRTEWASSFLVQPGIYRLVDATGKAVEHTRGFGHTETDFDAIERDYIDSPLGKHKYKATRFVGAASALAHPEYKFFWRKWIQTSRVINFAPSSRFPRTMTGDPLYHDACTLQGMPDSWPYEPKQTWLESFLEDVELVMDFDSM